MTTLQSSGMEAVRFLQRLHPEADNVASVLALLVKPEFMLVILFPLLFWVLSQRVIACLLTMLLMDGLLGEMLRILLAQPRPTWLGDIYYGDHVTSIYSSPAGYTSMSVIMVGYLCMMKPRAWCWFLGGLFIVLTAGAKMYQGAALPDHLLLGMLQGLIVLMLFKRYESRLFAYLQQTHLVQRYFIGIAVVAVSTAFIGLALAIHATYTFPTQWVEYTVVPSHRLAHGPTPILAGLLVGGLMAIGGKPVFMASKWQKWAAGILAVLGGALMMVVIRPLLNGVVDHAVWVFVTTLLVSYASYVWALQDAGRLASRLKKKRS